VETFLVPLYTYKAEQFDVAGSWLANVSSIPETFRAFPGMNQVLLLDLNFMVVQIDVRRGRGGFRLHAQ
jgi:hypothetical protein